MIIKYQKEKINTALLFKMSNAEFGSVSFNLLIVKKDHYKESDPIEDQYVAFTTNTPCRTKEELIATLSETYRQRWIVETIEYLCNRADKNLTIIFGCIDRTHSTNSLMTIVTIP